ncbi:DNA ligase (ATP) [hydrothermal vent metagenome]|uniref:DNA ligase (ATP) n=1 Tax=hydrothermal vent metagenome TaxID=652676 RepID=A0A3B0VBY5_9ZZZZ
MIKNKVNIIFGLICLFGLLCVLPPRALAATTEVMLPKVYKGNVDVSGWLLSEKLDGVRGYWTGTALLSKHGIAFHPPKAFTRGLPPFAIEGEIWGGRNSFEQTAATVKKQNPDPGWLRLKFAIFDVPKAKGGFLERIKKAKVWFAKHPSPYAFVIPQRPIESRDEISKELQRIEKLGGEGLIIRKADALYKQGRSSEILKVKSYDDMEAVVLAYIPGKGRNKGRLGALLVKLADGKRLKIGTGFSDSERVNPPPIGSVITFKYYGFYQSGLPKFPSFLRIRADNGL